MRYTDPAGLKAVLRQYGYDYTTDYADVNLEEFIISAEAAIDEYCNRTFGYRKINEMMNGRDNATLMLNHHPVLMLEKLVVRYYPLTIVRTFIDGDGYIILDRSIGKCGIRPSYGAVQSFPTSPNRYSYLFGKGVLNINAQYHVGHHMVGDNIGMDAIGSYQYNDVMSVSTDATYAYFTLPFAIGRVGYKVFKGTSVTTLTDDTSAWTFLDGTVSKFTSSYGQIRCAIANYNVSQIYRLVYIPAVVYRAAGMLAASEMLLSLQGRDDTVGSGGVASTGVAGFNESYGKDGRNSPQISGWRDKAFESLKNLVLTNAG